MSKRDTDSCRETADKRDLERFTLHSGDIKAPDTIAHWIELNIHTAPEEKLREALDCALEMRKNPDSKHPD